MPYSLPRARALAVAPLLALALGACRDAPTVPASVQLLAGGEEWVAMPAPRELPSLESWLPYVDRESDEGREALARIGSLSSRAERARAAGRLGDARLLAAEAERVAVLSLSRYPEPRVLREALFAVDFWADRVQAEVALEGAPRMAEALAEVRDAQDHAQSFLAQGDTTSAVLHLAAASERIHSFTPEAVALRVLSRVEARLRAQESDEPGVRRALHLLASSREELLSGDPRRALHRALYALQLAHGNEVPAPPEEPCMGPGC